MHLSSSVIPLLSFLEKEAQAGKKKDLGDQKVRQKCKILPANIPLYTFTVCFDLVLYCFTSAILI